MYRARIGMQERAELCPYHSQMPKTKSFSNHQDNIVNERSDAIFYAEPSLQNPCIAGVSGAGLTRSVRRNFEFFITPTKRVT